MCLEHFGAGRQVVFFSLFWSSGFQFEEALICEGVLRCKRRLLLVEAGPVQGPYLQSEETTCRCGKHFWFATNHS